MNDLLKDEDIWGAATSPETPTFSDADLWGQPSQPQQQPTGEFSDADLWGGGNTPAVEQPGPVSNRKIINGREYSLGTDSKLVFDDKFKIVDDPQIRQAFGLVDDPGIGDYASELGRSTVRGLAGAASSTGKGLGVLTSDNAAEIQRVEQGIANLKNMSAEEATAFMQELPRKLSPAVAFNYQVAIRKLWKDDVEGAKPYLETARKYIDTTPVEEQALTKGGKKLEEATNAAFPQDPRFKGSITSDIGQAAGSAAFFLPIGLLTGGTGVAVAGAAAGSSESYDKARQDITNGQFRDDRGGLFNAGLGTAAETTALQAGRLGALPGASEVVPTEIFLEQMPKYIPGLRTIANTPIWGKFAKAFGRVGTQVLSEGGQEAFQTWASNVVNQLMVNPSQDVSEDVLYSALLGGVVGGGMQTGVEGYNAVFGKDDTTGPGSINVSPPPPGAPPPSGATPPPTGPGGAQPSAGQAAPPPGAPPPAAPPAEAPISDDAYLMGAGYTPEQIDDMNPEERTSAAEEARAQGVEPVDLMAGAPAPGAAPMAPRGTRRDRVNVQSEQDIEAVRPTVNAEPTPAQAAAGNYQKGHIKIHGFDVSIENPKGSFRRGTDEDGTEWESPSLPADYGYIRGTTGKDGDHVDVYLGPAPESDKVFVIDQVNPKTQEFDEHKAVMGAASHWDAMDLYTGSFTAPASDPTFNVNRIGAVTEMTVDEFRDWVKKGRNTKRPAADSGVGYVTNGNMKRAPKAPSNQPAEINTAPGTTFQTAKGSTYEVHEDGTTTRNKAYRPEHGPAEQGPQPRSEHTFYVSADQLPNLDLVQATTPYPVAIVPIKPGQWGITYTDGPDKGKIISGTVAYGQDKPGVGLTPVEVWDTGRRVHFGNPIVSVGQQQAPADDFDSIFQQELDAEFGATPAPAPAPAKKKKYGAPAPVSVMDFIASLGGISDPTGELAGMDLPKMTKFGPVVRKNGLHPDKVREALVERGFLSDRGFGTDMQAETTENDVYDLLSQHMGGQKVFAPEDQARAADIATTRAADAQNPDLEGVHPIAVRWGEGIWNVVQDFLAENGSYEEAWSPGEINDVARMVDQGMSVDDAFERAALMHVDDLLDIPDIAPEITAAFERTRQTDMLDLPPFPDVEPTDVAQQPETPADSEAVRASGEGSGEPAGEAEARSGSAQVRDAGESRPEEGSAGQDFRGQFDGLSNGDFIADIESRIAAGENDVYIAPTNDGPEFRAALESRGWKMGRFGKKGKAFYSPARDGYLFYDAAVSGNRLNVQFSPLKAGDMADYPDFVTDPSPTETAPEAKVDNGVLEDSSPVKTISEKAGSAKFSVNVVQAEDGKFSASYSYDLQGQSGGSSPAFSAADRMHDTPEEAISAAASSMLRQFEYDFRTPDLPESKKRDVKKIILKLKEIGGVSKAEAPTTEKGADAKEQLVIPGAERDQKGALNNAAKAPLKGSVPQKGMDVGLFGSERDQTDMFDKPAPKVDEPTAENFDDVFGEELDAAFEAKPKAEAKPRTAGQAAKSAAKNTAQGMGEIVQGLEALFGNKNKLSSGFTFDEESYAKALPLFKAAVSHLGEAVKDMREVIRALIKKFRENGMSREALEGMAPYLKRFADDIRDGKETLDAPGSSEILEPDRGDADAGDPVGGADVSPAGGADGPRTRSGGAASNQGNGGRRGGRRLPQSDAPVVGENGNLELPAREPRAPGSDAADGKPVRGPESGSDGLPDDRLPLEEAAATVGKEANVGFEEKLRQQQAAEKLPSKPRDLANIRATLPVLTKEQQEDVLKVEERYNAPEGHGVLITNGTGTGKTFSGLGVVKRFARNGKKNILIVAPSQGILLDWQKAAKHFGLDLNILESTQDKGKGITATTYANLGENPTLVDREWDLIVTDESHKLSSDKDGTPTKPLQTLRALTLHPDGMYRRGQMAFRKEWDAYERLKPTGKNPSAVQVAAADEAYAAWRAKYDAALPGWQAAERNKVLMLSATPFAYHFSLDYAEGYLFKFGEDSNSGAYNAPTGRSQFYISNFGYQMKTGKLNKPGPEVDTGVMERQFHEQMKRTGALFGRALEVEKDYDRKFIIAESAIGTKIDQALEFLSGAESGRFRALHDVIYKKFDYLTRMRLLEAIKAEASIPYIKKSLALGRKIVVFHDYNEGGGVSPFQLKFAPGDELEVRIGDKITKVNANDLYQEFLSKNPYVKDLDFAHYQSPIEAIQREFPDALIYNGTVSTKKRDEAKRLFNDDTSGRDIIVVQSAAGEAGISLHDLTGKKQRVLLNLGMPVRPTTALQEEGRIYRVGQQSDAIFRYMNTGTNWERWTFGAKIAERSSTAENLAMGDQARTIKQSFIDAFNNADEYPPTIGEGTGGKQLDRASNNALSEFERAKTHYFANQRLRGRRDQRQGIDYFPTPEPLGLKMVEWANVKPGEKILEPSAGHGAIARYFPETTARTLVEPSSELASQAALNSAGARVVVSRFEDLDIVNKYDAIVMNPPFGVGGKTAIEHLEKAVKHLKNGGRIVALLPTGGTADKRLDAWYEDAEGIYMVGRVDLPAVTFERAGTSIRAQVIILEKHTDKDVRPAQQSNRDFSSEDTIRGLFDRLENTEFDPRTEPKTKELDLPLTGEVTLDGITFDLTNYAPEAFDAKLKTYVPSRFRSLARAAEANGGFYLSSIKSFSFKTEAERRAFLEQVAKGLQQEQGAAAAPASSSSAGGGTHSFTTAEVTHAKTGKPLFVATLQDRVSPEIYQSLNATAKRHGGYYSSFRGNGAVPGFQFPSEEARSQFLAETQAPPQARLSSRAQGRLSSRSAESTFAAEVMAELAQVDDLFQLPRSKATTIERVIAETAPQMRPMGRFMLSESDQQNGVVSKKRFADEDGHQFFIMEDGDGQVWIDISDHRQGLGGSAVYAAVANYAHNAGKVFIGDPVGLSDEALRRRTEAMLSSALKFGTTRHIEPHPRQLQGSPEIGIPPLKWTHGNDADNVASLIEASTANTLNAVPELADARYDFASRTFRDAAGEPLTDGKLRDWRHTSRGARAAGAGRATLKRAIFLHTLLRAEGGARPRLLEHSLRQSRLLVEQGGLKGLLYSKAKPTFYSGLLRAVEGMKQDAAPKAQWMGQIRNTPGIKAEEIQWIGLESWLAEQSGQITKKQLTDFIKANQVEVQEVVKERKTVSSYRSANDYRDELWELSDQALGDAYALEFGFDVEDARQQAIDDRDTVMDELVEAYDQSLGGRGADDRGETTVDTTKFSKYQLPGGENYRELLLTLPDRAGEQLFSGYVFPSNDMAADGILTDISAEGLEDAFDYGRVDHNGAEYIEFNGLSPSQWAQVRQIVANNGEALSQTTPGPQGWGNTGDNTAAGDVNYRSGHWDEKNILAHVRFNERMVDGKKVLFIEEVQSDWHQTGRKKGYKLELSKEEGEALVEERRRLMRANDPRSARSDELTSAEKAQNEARIEEINRRIAQTNGVPDAPFKASWPELAMKRMIRWAAENGFDRIAWAPGDVQAERYDLSKKISRVDVESTFGTDADGKPTTKYYLSAYDMDGRPIIDGKKIKGEEEAADYVGKEVAEKLFSTDENARRLKAGLHATVKGLDLKVGGEGMKGFYDKILVDVANKIGKKWGAKVGQISVNNSGGKPTQYADFSAYERSVKGFGITVPSLEIPATMKAAAMEGQPLFKRRQQAEAAAPRQENPLRFVASQKQRNQIVAEIQQIAERILGHRLARVEIITSQAEWDVNFNPESDAEYDPNTGIIYIALYGTQDPRSTIRHEAVHALRQAQVITSQEWAVLSRMAQTRWMDQYNIRDRYEALYRERFDVSEAELEQILIEEAIADAMADSWGKAPTEDVIGRIFARMKAFLEAVRNALRGMGFTSASQILESTEKGAMARRNPGTGQGRDFLLYARQSAMGDGFVNTPAFKKWFGDSKVVDEQGKPRVVFHGTAGDFAEFDASLAGRNYPSSGGNRGLFFTSKPGTASVYAEKAAGAYLDPTDEENAHFGDGTANIMPVYLSLQSPIIVNTKQRADKYFDYNRNRLYERADRSGADGIIVNGSDRTLFVAFNPTQIKSATGNNGNFDPNNQSILSSRRRLPPPRNPAPGSFEAPHDERVRRALLDSTDTLLNRLRRAGRAFGNEFRRKVQDRELDLMRTQSAIEQGGGGPLSEPQNAYLAASLYPGRVAQRDQDLVEDVVEPLIQDIARRGLSLEEVNDFVMARHAIERNLEVAKIHKPGTQFHEAATNPTIVGGSGLSENQATDILNEAVRTGKLADLEAVGDRIVAMNRDTLDKLYSEGLITQEQYDALTQKYQYYVPLQGWDDVTSEDHPDSPRTGRRYDVRGKEFQQAFGRTSKADSPLAYSIMQARQAQIRIEKNRVGKRFLRLAQANPNEAFWQVSRVDLKKMIDPNTGYVRNVFDRGAQEAENVYAVKVGGKRYNITIHHDGLLKAMKGIGGENMGDFVGFFHKMTRFLAMMNTQLDPEFIFRNFLRDIQQAGIVLQEEQTRGITRKVITSIPQAAYGMNQMLNGNLTSPWARYAREFADAGGKIGFMDRTDVDTEKANLQRLLRQANAGWTRKTLRAANEMTLERLARYNDTIENTLRLSTYVALRQAGATRDRAAFVARELTVNFNRKGELSPMINAGWMFFNASTQGAATLFMRLGRSRRIQAVAAAIIVEGILMDMLNRMIGGDDDDEKNRYDKIPIEERSRNHIFMMPKWVEDEYGIPYFKAPLPLGWNWFHIIGQQASQAVAGAVTPLEAFGNITGSFVDSFNPLGGGDMIATLTPTLLDPFVEIARNKDFFGENITPRQFDETTPQAERYKPNVSPQAKQLTDALSSATGGSPERPGAIDISPEWVEHLADFAFGGLGRFFTRSMTTAQAWLGGEEIDGGKVPFKRVFVGRDSTFADRDEYFQIRDAVHVTDKELRARIAEKNPEAVAAVRRNYARELKMMDLMDTAEKQLTKLRKDYKAVKNAQKMSEAGRAKRLEAISQRMDEIQLKVRTRWHQLGKNGETAPSSGVR